MYLGRVELIEILEKGNFFGWCVVCDNCKKKEKGISDKILPSGFLPVGWAHIGGKLLCSECLTYGYLKKVDRFEEESKKTKIRIK